MLTIPNTVFNQYDAVLRSMMVPIAQFADYKKWLRYFLDFCAKYNDSSSAPEQVRPFLEKLREKKQTEEQRAQAEQAIKLYVGMKHAECASGNNASVAGEYAAQYLSQVAYAGQSPQSVEVHSGSSHYCDAGYQVKSASPEWDAVLETMAGEIKVRHYSRKTLKTYANWSRQFQRFLNNKPPQELTKTDVKEYLTFLAVKCKVAASTQNQAFNSLLFLFRHGLKRDFGMLHGVPRAKKSLYIPTVLSRAEIDSILAHLSRTHSLVVKLLFGCGLRLFECLQLRVGEFNFETGKLLVHGKGKKDRTVP